MLQACLNGARMRDYHPAVPFSGAELAKDAELVVAAGAQELHIHPRGPDGMETLDPVIVANTLRTIREVVPSVPIGLSTQWSIAPVGRARHEPIHHWETLPDYVSINLIEEDASDLMSLVFSKGIGVEAGLWSISDAERFVRLNNADQCLRVLIEILEQDIEEGLKVANDIQNVLKNAGINLPILLHGDEASVWPIYREAMVKKFDSRIGLEDYNRLPSGQMARDNAELIQTAVNLVW
ncbi:3-keto-5-aminohexanoate cleavage protein [Phyllobacterium sp. SB3]|uniref:3-keto-5-aminohexanoate cleavage protein n=1 Tax=Phyllobacterium sp. SB3 TaxID=3156073 RepID=UPI0032AFC03F